MGRAGIGTIYFPNLLSLGKTNAYKVLAHALSDLHEAGEAGVMGERKVLYTVINPKSMSMGQLYGEWVDGVLANAFREYATPHTQTTQTQTQTTHGDAAEGDARKWIVLDSPVDIYSIQFVESVLQDKRFFFMNGETLDVPDWINLIFETQNLTTASPGIISRCGTR